MAYRWEHNCASVTYSNSPLVRPGITPCVHHYHRTFASIVAVAFFYVQKDVRTLATRTFTDC